MESPLQVPVTPEQLAAVQAGGGFVCVEDPTTRRIFFLIEQSDPVTIGDEYVREKINEAYAEGGDAPLDMAAIKSELLRRQSARNSPQ